MKQIYTDPIIVVIATSFARTEILLKRALTSVYNQTNINPHQIYIVDDNPIAKDSEFSDEYGKIKKVIKDLQKTILKEKFKIYKEKHNIPNLRFENFFHTTIIKNTRTKGFSGTGAWNTAAFKSMQYSGRNYFLAFLDDDDEWNKNYLQLLYAETKKTEERRSIAGKTKTIKPVAVIAGINRIEKDKLLDIICNKDNFTRENFFIKNPGLQGSNLFIELKTFWTIGGFDESLKSATDRDLAIRLIDYVNLRTSKSVKFINKILVNHYAINENRVTAISKNKKEGLDTFYRKYLHQFSKDIQKQSLDRAKKLFNYTLPETVEEKNISKRNTSQINNETSNDTINLIIGTISDNETNLRELFKSFYNLLQKYNKNIVSYKFLVLENTNNEYKIRPIINYFTSIKNLDIEIIPQHAENKSISENRNILQKKIYEKGQTIFEGNFIAWIIDDDCLFKADTINGETIIPNYFKYFSDYSKQSYDAIFGQVSDAPPLPFLSTLRTQLLDFYYNLSYFAHCNPSDKFELNNLQKINAKQNEFYYDLSSKNYQHLEYPYFQYKNELTNKEAFIQFIKETALLSNGVNVFRKLEFDKKEIGKITKPSIYRGGNTIVFNPELLNIPNYTPDKEYNRRSDFNWSIINNNILNCKLLEAVLPLKHERKLQKTSLVTNETKLQADIKGLIFYRLFEKIVSRENWEEKNEYKNELRFYNQLKKQTLTKIKINNFRIQNLLHLILNILENRKLWWYNNEFRAELNYYIQQNIFTLEVLIIELGKRKFQLLLKYLERNMKIDDKFIKRIIADMKKIKM